jgi:hypothetical protein
MSSPSWTNRCSAGSGWWPHFVLASMSSIDPDTSYTTFGRIGGIFIIIGIGMLALGVPLMIACFARLKPFFRGETLNADTGDPDPRHGRAAARRGCDPSGRVR